MGLGVMSADGTHNPTSTIQHLRSRGKDRPEQQNIFSSSVTLTNTGSGREFFQMPPQHAKPRTLYVTLYRHSAKQVIK